MSGISSRSGCANRSVEPPQCENRVSNGFHDFGVSTPPHKRRGEQTPEHNLILPYKYDETTLFASDTGRFQFRECIYQFFPRENPIREIQPRLF